MKTLFALLALTAVVAAQSSDKKEFEVATVKASPAPDGRGFMVGCRGGAGTADPTTYRCTNMSLTNMVTMAYEMDYYRVTAPDWAETTRFELNARVPEGATKKDQAEMLRHLLEDRFKLVVHHESKEIVQYDLVVGKGGSKLKPAVEPSTDNSPRGPIKLGEDGYPALPKGQPGMAIMRGRARSYQPASTIEPLARLLTNQLHAPVHDATGLTGKYEIDLYWFAGDPGPDEEPGPTLIQAVAQQLGLRLEQKKGPVDIVVVDHVEKTPLEN